MAVLLPEYVKGSLAHVLFAHEGIYFLHLSTKMMTLLTALPKWCVNTLGLLIGYYYGHLEQYRTIEYDRERVKCMEATADPSCLTYNSAEKRRSINKIVYIIQETTLNDILSGDVDKITDVELREEMREDFQEARKCVTLAEQRVKISADSFPIFDVQYFSMDDGVKNGITVQLPYRMAPVNTTCSLPDFPPTNDLNFGGKSEKKMMRMKSSFEF